MENIMQDIMKAEEQASAMKQDAVSRAAEIVATAEKKAAETEKNAREVCKAYKTTQNAAAIKAAEQQYAETVAQKAAECKAQSEEKMQSINPVVANIVGRIIHGDC